ncbi:MAG: sigma-70 family RNA polymerase sigma factor [Firmicutes bacterium]|nr:sigma-70 family RNA polymerase sigma factor [Bacillota bacterium]
MSNYKVDITGINTSDLKSLSHKENMELFKALNEGDKFAKEKLVNGNLKLVLSVLKGFNKHNLNMDDLFQVGVIGLIKAIDNFDVSYNLKLSTYGVPLILGEIKKYLRDNTSIRVSRSIKDNAYQILRFKEDYINVHGREPSNYEISTALGMKEYEIGYALESLREPMSIFEPIYNDGGDTIYLEDQIADKKELNQDKDMRILLHKSLNKIKERERLVLINRFIIGKTQAEIADKLGISQAQVSRIEKSALANLKKMIN